MTMSYMVQQMLKMPQALELLLGGDCMPPRFWGMKIQQTSARPAPRWPNVYPMIWEGLVITLDIQSHPLRRYDWTPKNIPKKNTFSEGIWNSRVSDYPRIIV